MTDPTPQTTPTRDEAVRIDLCDGKYTVIHSNGRGLRALRYGEEWRDLTGDGLVLAMAQEIEDLRSSSSDPAPANGGVDAVAVSRMDVVIALREWFGGERYARDYEYLDMQMGPQMKATLEAVFKDRRERASLSPAATPVSEAGGEATGKPSLQVGSIPRAVNTGRYLAETNDGRLLYLNHANEWQEMPNILAKPASSPAGGGVHEAAIGLLSELDAYCVGSRAYDRRVNEARRALKAALSQSTSAGKANGT